jgi:hypothetical protein
MNGYPSINCVNCGSGFINYISQDEEGTQINVKKAYAISNNAIYFADSSDYLTALYDICRILKPDVDNSEIGKKYIGITCFWIL